MKKSSKRGPSRLAILQDENGHVRVVASDSPALKGVRVAIVRDASASEWDVGRPTAVLVQHRHDEPESIAKLVELGFFESVETDQALLDGMRDIEGFDFNIRLLLDSAFRMEPVICGCERYTPQHADPLFGTEFYAERLGPVEV